VSDGAGVRSDLARFAEALAVVGGDDDQGVLEDAAVAERRDDRPSD